MMMCVSPVVLAETIDNAQESQTQVESASQRINAEAVVLDQALQTLTPAVSRSVSDTEQAAILSPLTAHTAEYKVFYGSIELGVANYRLPATDSGFYRYYFDSDVSLLIISDQRHLKSEFTLENGKLVPFRYIHERTGTGSDYTEQTAFAKAQKFIHTIYKQDALKLPYEDQVFDPLMVQLQFRMDLAANLRPLDYKMVKEKEVDDYQFRVVGKEKMTIESGTYDTIKVEVVRDNTKRQTLLWMAPDLAYLPIRLSHYSKGSKQLDIQLAQYHFEQQLPPMTPALMDVGATQKIAENPQTNRVEDASLASEISDADLTQINQLAAEQ